MKQSFIIGVFATGRDGIGCPNIPNFVDSLPKKFWAHSSDDIDNTLAKKKRCSNWGWSICEMAD